MSKIVEEMLKLQKDWDKNTYKQKTHIINTNEVFEVAYAMYDKEKADVGLLENKVFNYDNRVQCIKSFCIMFKNTYNERKDYYDELLEYWEDEK